MVESSNSLTVRLCSLQPWSGSYRRLSVTAKISSLFVCVRYSAPWPYCTYSDLKQLLLKAYILTRS